MSNYIFTKKSPTHSQLCANLCRHYYYLITCVLRVLSTKHTQILITTLISLLIIIYFLPRFLRKDYLKKFAVKFYIIYVRNIYERNQHVSFNKWTPRYQKADLASLKLRSKKHVLRIVSPATQTCLSSFRRHLESSISYGLIERQAG